MIDPQPRKPIHPIVILLGILGLAMVMTWLVDSGSYARDGKLVVPGSFELVDKQRSMSMLFATPQNSAEQTTAHPVGLIDTLLSVPQGLKKMAGLIFMVMIIGGMFGIITKAGVVDAAMERMLSLARGNIYLLVPVLMVVFSAGSTFLGFATEYLLIIPLVVAMANRVGLSNAIGLAIVTVAVKVGYLASVTNPIPLSIAQPLVNVQVFSGAGLRFAFYLCYLLVGIVFVLWAIRREGFDQQADIEFVTHKLTRKQSVVLSLLLIGIAFLVYSSNRWHWDHEQLSSYYIALSMILALATGMSASDASEAFVSGMKKTLMASFLIGVASAVAITLEKGMILDSIVHQLTSLIGDGGALLAAEGMFATQLLLDFLIPSTSGQAAISMPIMGPIGQLSGVPPQTTVLAFLFGNGITNILTPTSGTLLAYLATAEVSWSRWAKLVFPLWLIFIGMAATMIAISLALTS